MLLVLMQERKWRRVRARAANLPEPRPPSPHPRPLPLRPLFPQRGGFCMVQNATVYSVDSID